MLFEICADDGIRSRVEAEMDCARGAETGSREMDVGKLCAGPTLQSIYAEVLRMRMAVLVSRTPLKGDFRAGDWVYPAGKPIVISSATAGSNSDAWAKHTHNGRHGLDKFWADRFLVHEEGNGEQKKKFSVDGLSGAWIPYGGGPFMCPGRHFAKQEMIGSAAVFLDQFEMRLSQKSTTWPPRADKKFYGFGALPPLDTVACRVRRKKKPISKAEVLD